jgi:hypothetical protein
MKFPIQILPGRADGEHDLKYAAVQDPRDSKAYRDRIVINFVYSNYPNRKSLYRFRL